MIHFVLMHLVIFLYFLMKRTRHNFIQYLDVLQAIILFVINCLELSTALSILARKHYIVSGVARMELFDSLNHVSSRKTVVGELPLKRWESSRTNSSIGLLHWITALDYRIGLPHWITALDYRIGLPHWITALDYR